MLAESADFSGFLRGPPQGERSGEAEQWQGVLRTGQAVPGVCSRHVLFPWASPALEWRGCLHCGVTETKVSAGCFQETEARSRRHGCCFSSSPGPCAGGSVYAWRCRHSTKKRTSTTNRTAKRTAMAHHWRRSARRDTRISSLGTLPSPRHSPTKLKQKGTECAADRGRAAPEPVQPPGTQRRSAPGPHCTCRSPGSCLVGRTCFLPHVCKTRGSQLSAGTYCVPGKDVGTGVPDQSPPALSSLQSQII